MPPVRYLSLRRPFHHDCPGTGTPLSRISPVPTLGLVLYSFPPHYYRRLVLLTLSLPLAIALPLGAILLVPRCIPHITHARVSYTGSASSPSQLRPSWHACAFLSSPHPCYTLTTALSLFLAACCVPPTLGCLRYVNGSSPSPAATFHWQGNIRGQCLRSQSTCRLAFFVISSPFSRLCTCPRNALHIFSVPAISQISPYLITVTHLHS